MQQPNSKDKHKYNRQKNSAVRRKDRNGNPIEFRLTFEQWWKFWQESGVYHLRGCGKKSYCMGRYNDIGHYELGNIYVCTNAENATAGTKGIKHTDEHKAKISKAHTGRKTELVTCPHCNKKGGIHNMMRYHFNKCKQKK